MGLSFNQMPKTKNNIFSMITWLNALVGLLLFLWQRQAGNIPYSVQLGFFFDTGGRYRHSPWCPGSYHRQKQPRGCLSIQHTAIPQKILACDHCLFYLLGLFSQHQPLDFFADLCLAFWRNRSASNEWKFLLGFIRKDDLRNFYIDDHPVDTQGRNTVSGATDH